MIILTLHTSSCNTMLWEKSLTAEAIIQACNKDKSWSCQPPPEEVGGGWVAKTDCGPGVPIIYNELQGISLLCQNVGEDFE